MMVKASMNFMASLPLRSPPAPSRCCCMYPYHLLLLLPLSTRAFIVVTADVSHRATDIPLPNAQPTLLLQFDPSELASPQNRRGEEITQRPTSRSDRRVDTGHDGRLGGLWPASARPRPAHLRRAAEERRGHDPPTSSGDELQAVHADMRQHRCLYVRQRVPNGKGKGQVRLLGFQGGGVEDYFRAERGSA